MTSWARLTSRAVKKYPSDMSTTSRGYGNQHQKIRKALEPLVATGDMTCARCGEPIRPGTPWDLGHDDYDRSVWSGPEHRRCNRRTAARRKVKRRQWSREW